MDKKLFKGFKQVTKSTFEEAKNSNELSGYIWFVRTPVEDEGESNVSNDEYDIYFGSRKYGHYCESDKKAVNSLNEKVLGIIESLELVTASIEEVDKAYQAADKVLSDSIVVETEAREAADAKLGKDMEAEVAARIAADSVLNDAIAAETEARIAAVNELDGRVSTLVGDDANKSVRKIANEELAAQLLSGDADADFKTLQELAAWLEDHPESVTEINAKITETNDIIGNGFTANSTVTEAVNNINKTLKDHEGKISTLEGVVGDSENGLVKNVADNASAIDALEEKINEIENGAEVNVIESISVNGIDAEIVDKKASVKVDANDIELGVDLSTDGEVKYDKSAKISSVLQGIQNSITQAAAGSYLGVISGNGIEVGNIIGNQQTVSVKVSNEKGNLITVTEKGIFAAMFYDGDDVEPSDIDPSDVDPSYVKSLIEKGGDVVLNADINVDNSIVLTNVKSTVDLNENKVQAGLFAESNGVMSEGDTDSYAFWVKDGAELVINGNGVVESQAAKYSMAVWANGGTVTINGGTFVNAGNGSDLIYASNGGKVYIYGGEFKPCEMQEGTPGTSQKYCALNIKDKDRENSEIKVYGGKFYGFNPANNTSEGPNTNFVADGYKSVEVETGVWEVIPE